jgi:glycosyltransferase involved in cell wall biosynthesis
MNISYINIEDSSDIHYWSGLGYNIAQMLENQHVEVSYIDNLHSKLRYVMKAKKIVLKSITGKTFDINRDPIIVKKFADKITKRLSDNTDIIFSPSTIPISLLETKKPKVIYTDCTFAGMIGFYDYFSNLCDETIKDGNYVEQQALDSSQLIIFSSDWAAQSAINHYQTKPDKIKVVPFGANLVCNREMSDIKTIISARSEKTLDLLFLGVDWNRKGGDLALKITEQLNSVGIKTTLHVMGIDKLPFETMPKFVVNHGFVSKLTQEGINKIESLLESCHFLVLPTKADCTPVVYSEANSFGLPCLTTNVGGIPTLIKNDVNGHLFTLQDDAQSWCNYIATVFAEKERYKTLCMSSFAEYEDRLNWNSAGKTIIKLMKEI